MAGLGMGWQRALCALVLAAPALSSWAEDAPAPEAAPAAPAAAEAAPLVIQDTPTPVEIAPQPTAKSAPSVQLGCSLRDYGAAVERGGLAKALFNTCEGFSLHKPTFMGIGFSDRYNGSQTELLFQFSGKVSLWGWDRGQDGGYDNHLYFAYSQKSFFQVFNEKRSKAFRESNYNPELFVRLRAPVKLLPSLNIDLGLEHESNGQDLPDSRSYNRLYWAPFYARGNQAFQVKMWWRVPEDDQRDANDPKRDDNPDLGRYLGYTELRWRQDFGRHNSLLDIMVRGNLGEGKGAVQVDYSAGLWRQGSVFVRLFSGYGESLIDYNRSVNRVLLGFSLQQ